MINSNLLFYYNIETVEHSHDYASSAYNPVEAEVVAKFCRRLRCQYDLWNTLISNAKERGLFATIDPKSDSKIIVRSIIPTKEIKHSSGEHQQ
ncbi:unnamed protein product [Didymodactylos carnosus]|uniref:Uncharacterized protein n=1 Tax=Didymodactylos carnosus TaxID=1234261 RepID=A0A813WFD9_9BILA|nr:unnamed protein product [Didymodactylos carnosus]CAF1568299.1 unnamed protein product [Didymodactylos carnosus]CAF3641926.1 unnamed protein product [Didymodactylos carnosus]CAF4361893.1 unnamed protein product [Didymodactylos carnosus]